MRISDWSSDVCSSDLTEPASLRPLAHRRIEQRARSGAEVENAFGPFLLPLMSREVEARLDQSLAIRPRDQRAGPDLAPDRPEIAIAETLGDRLMAPTARRERLAIPRPMTVPRVEPPDLPLHPNPVRPKTF